MKILIDFQPNKKLDNFEGARLRKTIKGALELTNIDYVTNVIGTYDVMHLISPNDENKLLYGLEIGIPVIVSALYTEDDPTACYLDYKNKNGVRSISIKPKALRFLNKANLVLVPSDKAKQFLIDNGVLTKIKVLVPGVNLSRFNFSRDDEKEIFYRYFREDSSKKLVLALGEYNNNMDGLTAIINAAKKNPDTLFYYVGRDEKAKLSFKIKKKIKKAPNNLKFKGVMADDVYRSALMNADIFMLAGYKTTGTVSLYEAMAAKCQLIVRKPAIFSDMLINEETAYIAEYSETLTSLVCEYIDNSLQPTIESAYIEAQKHSLLQFGEELAEIYKSVIK